MSLSFDASSGLITDDEDGQHVAELCDGATPEQGASLAACYNRRAALVSALRECREALKDHVQYEDDEDGSNEGDAFRTADALLVEIDMPS